MPNTTDTIPRLISDDILPTTDDNPFDPFTQWDRWISYDRRAGHNTWEHMEILMRPSNELTEAELDDLYSEALLSLLTYHDPYNIRNLAVRGKTRRFGIKLPDNKKNNKEK